MRPVRPLIAGVGEGSTVGLVVDPAVPAGDDVAVGMLGEGLAPLAQADIESAMDNAPRAHACGTRPPPDSIPASSRRRVRSTGSRRCVENSRPSVWIFGPRSLRSRRGTVVEPS